VYLTAQHETPLHFACSRGKLDVAQLLLDHGAQVNVKNHKGETPLHLASRGDHDSLDEGVCVVELLLERGTDVNIRDKSEWTPLHSASNNGKYDIAQVLLSHGANVNAENYLGETPLHLVGQCKYGSQDGVRVAQLLLDGGVDVNARDKCNCTPLHAASYYGQLEIAQVLLDHGATKEAKDDEGKTPLHQAVQVNFESHEAGPCMVELLLDWGLDVNAQDDKLETPLHMACCYGRLEIVQVLLRHASLSTTHSKSLIFLYPDSKYFFSECISPHTLLRHCADVSALAKNDWTPLHYACYWGRLEIAQMLLDHGAKVILKTEPGETALHAVAKGKYEHQEDGVSVAQLLLACGLDPNVQDEHQSTPLHIASSYGKLEIIQLLLDHGAKVNAMDDKGETPLHRVLCDNYNPRPQDGVHIANLLLEHGGDVNAQTKQKQTPLHFASYFGKPEIAHLLFVHGAIVNTPDNNRETALHKVSQNNHDSEEAYIGVVQLLLEHSGNVNAQTKQQRTPLHFASYFGKLKIAHLLLNHGAKVGVSDDISETALHKVSCGKYNSEAAGVGVVQLLLEHGEDVNVQTKQQQTPLHFASYFGKLEIARLLLSHGASIDTLDKFGKTPLHDVCLGQYDSEKARVGVAQLLLECGGNVNMQAKQQTPLHVASYFGKLDIVQLLLDHGANVDALDKFGKTPLHYISKSKNKSKAVGIDVAQLLLKHGGNVNAETKNQRTPLHVASYFGKLEIAQVLIEHGANVNASEFFGETPLHYVSRGECDSKEANSVVQLLLKHGGDVNAQTKQQWTPLHVASYHGKLEITQLLLKHGANVDALDEFGKTPLHHASQSKYAGVDVAQLVLEWCSENVNAQNMHQQKPLHSTSSFGKLKIAQLLLDHGANVDASDKFGKTPLHYVSQGKYETYDSESAIDISISRPMWLSSGHGRGVNVQAMAQQTPLERKLEMAQLLLDRGAKVDVVNHLGDTPLHCISKGEYDSEEAGVGVAMLLLKYGADMNTKNKAGKSPLDHVSWSLRPSINRLFRSHGAIASVNAQLESTRPRASSSRIIGFSAVTSVNAQPESTEPKASSSEIIGYM
jgi:ankyrin